MAGKGGKKRRRSLGTVIFLLLAVAAVAVIAYVIHAERLKKPEAKIPAKKERKVAIPSPGVSPETVRQPEKKPDDATEKQPIVPGKPSAALRKIAIVIDDIGYDLKILKELGALDAPVTFAVLPFCPHSMESARILHNRGREIMLHLPMEPHKAGNNNPGKGVLLVSMTDNELLAQLEANINAVPYARGVNNHMGSRFMEEREKVSLVLKRLQQKGLFFVDSRTTPNSKGEEEARKIGIPYATRKVFIDNGANYSETLNMLMRLADNADQQDKQPLLLIGHPHSSTLEALKKALPLLKEKGIEVVSVSDILQAKPYSKISHKTN